MSLEKPPVPVDVVHVSSASPPKAGELEAEQDALVHELHLAALSYFERGMKVFHEEAARDYFVRQVAVGMLGVSVELFIKKFLARKHLLLVLQDTPQELKAALLCPDYPRETWYPHFLRLKARELNFIEFGPAVALYLGFRPNLQALKPHLDALIRARNASVHGVLAETDIYQIERAAFVALKVAQNETGFPLTTEDLAFEKAFAEARVQRVERAVKQARERSRKATPENLVVPIARTWSECELSCPICSGMAIMTGRTQLQGVQGRVTDVA